MYTLNHTLDRNVLDADGDYLGTQGLNILENYFQTYTVRLEAYTQLREQNEQFVQQALKSFERTHPEIVQQHTKRCLYDMTEVVRYIAVSILRDDEVFFKEQLMSWLDTVLLAHKKHTQCIVAYRHLRDVIKAKLPVACNALVQPYIDNIIVALQGHA
jgi:hypothetical protein